jgi:serine protease inhibitor
LLSSIATRGNTTFLSPISIVVSLSMLCNGLAKESSSFKELVKEMFPGIEKHQYEWIIGQANIGLRDTLTSISRSPLMFPPTTPLQSSFFYTSPPTKPDCIIIASSVWVKRGLSISPTFQDRLRSIFDGEIMELQSVEKQSVDQVNKWVETATQGSISSIVKQIDSNMLILLINAVYFKGTWKFQFDKSKTYQCKFNGLWPSMVSMMIQKGVTLPLADSLMYTAVQLPYNDDQFYAIAMLPKGSGSLVECLSQLEAPNIMPFEDTLLDLRLPSFKVETELDLGVSLCNLGVKSIFDYSHDFAPMIANSVPSRIDKIIQKVVVEVTEEGTVAAAVTAGMFGGFGASQRIREITFDKPFLFSIHHKTSGAILFLGSVEQPRT